MTARDGRVLLALVFIAVLVAGGTLVASGFVSACPDRPTDPTCISVGAPTRSSDSAAASDGQGAVPAPDDLFLSSIEPLPTPTFGDDGTPSPGVSTGPTQLPVQATPGPDGPTPVPPTALPRPPITFDDEFSGSSLSSKWGRHWSSVGLSRLSRSQTSVGGGLLTIAAVRSGDGWQSDLVDAFSSFRQTYGYFEARIRIPEGRGLWPAFWLAQDWAASLEEFDIMEVCANPPGTNDGNDVTVLHQIIHAPGVDRSGSTALQARVPMSNDWHTYGLDWRPDHVDFYVDGVRTFHYGNAAAIPNVPMTPILSLGLGSWCGRPDATTPSPSVMQVDWVRVRK